MNDDLAKRHSERFGKVGIGYPLRVAEAYGGDLAAASRDTDKEVATKVHIWELMHCIEPRDWLAVDKGLDE